MDIKKSAIAALVGIITAGAAQAQHWTSHQSGNQRNYTGDDENGGAWIGSSHRSGDQTNSTFYGPNGQTRSCTSRYSGNRLDTNCD